MTEKKPSSRWKTIYKEWFKPLVIMLAVLFAVRSSLADWNDVPTQSMEPTILVGDRIAVNKLAYGLKFPFTTWHLMKWSAPCRGEIIVFYSPKDGARMVKRIIGTPGDTITLINNKLVINGEPMTLKSSSAEELEAFDLTDDTPAMFAMENLGEVAHGLMFQPTKVARRSFEPLTVPKGHYLVLGDNRDNSADSRYFGLVPREQILGRVYGIAISLDHDEHYKPRWRRFFRGLD